MNNLVEYTDSGMPLDISARLKPCSASEIQAELAKLCACFSIELDGAQTSIYFEALQGQPIWAIKRAAKEFRLGTVPDRRNHSFMPKPPELGNRVREIVKPHLENSLVPVKREKFEEFKKEGTPESRREFAIGVLAKSPLFKTADDHAEKKDDEGLDESQ